jgi:hypothetical protein
VTLHIVLQQLSIWELVVSDPLHACVSNALHALHAPSSNGTNFGELLVGKLGSADEAKADPDA